MLGVGKDKFDKTTDFRQIVPPAFCLTNKQRAKDAMGNRRRLSLKFELLQGNMAAIGEHGEHAVRN